MTVPTTRYACSLRTPAGAGVALLLLLLAGCAVQRTPYSRDGFYAGAAAIGSVSSFDDDGSVDLGDSDVVAGIGLRGGFRFNDQFAVEVEYQGSDDYEFANDVDIFLQSFGVNGKFFMLTGRMQPYVLAGIGSLDAEVDIASLDEAQPYYRLGIGLEGYFNRNVASFFEVETNIPTDDLDDLTYNSALVGFLYRF
jgi:hypothetical protein